MATVTVPAGERLLTAEEYAELSFPTPTELVRGKVVEVEFSCPREGLVCGNILHLLDESVGRRDLGYVLPNMTGFITHRGPDTVRGPDVSFYSYAKMPKGELPQSYSDVPPELVFEVISPSDRWRDVLEKVVEYLDAGVLAVCVLDPERETAHVNTAEKVGELFAGDQELAFEDILPGFSVCVSDFFAS
jgi:Uma2 family endonuclease